MNGISISLRLPDSTKVAMYMLLLIVLALLPRSVFCVVWTCLQDGTFIYAQAIYEVAFASSSLTQPFNIYSIAPRILISPNLPLSQLQLHGSVASC